MLVSVVSSDRSEVRVKALGCLMNLSVSAETKVYLCSKELGHAPVHVSVASNIPEPLRATSN